MTYARGRIVVKDQRVANEEDIAQSAMKSFFRAEEAGRFRTLTNSDELVGECRERIEALPDEILRIIAVKRMEGFEVTAIAAEMSLSVQMVSLRSLGLTCHTLLACHTLLENAGLCNGRRVRPGERRPCQMLTTHPVDPRRSLGSHRWRSCDQSPRHL